MNRIELMRRALEEKRGTIKRRRYLSQSVRFGLASILARTKGMTDDEFRALLFLEDLLDARMAAPKAHDAQVSSDAAGRGNPAGRDEEAGREATQ